MRAKPPGVRRGRTATVAGAAARRGRGGAEAVRALARRDGEAMPAAGDGLRAGGRRQGRCDRAAASERGREDRGCAVRGGADGVGGRCAVSAQRVAPERVNRGRGGR